MKSIVLLGLFLFVIGILLLFSESEDDKASDTIGRLGISLLGIILATTGLTG